MYQRETPLLKRRIEELNNSPHKIPDRIYKRAMSAQAILDRVLLLQWPEEWYGAETYEGGIVHKPDSVKERQWNDTPRGLILSIGLGALDALRSNGVDVGHLVHFAANSPYRRILDDHDSYSLVLVRAGDLVDSEDLAAAIDYGVVAVTQQNGRHVLVDAEGKAWKPRLPWMEE